MGSRGQRSSSAGAGHGVQGQGHVRSRGQVRSWGHEVKGHRVQVKGHRMQEQVREYRSGQGVQIRTQNPNSGPVQA
ncbi:hypothetical protein ACOMHN_026309 [Nucella lapillus]